MIFLISYALRNRPTSENFYTTADGIENRNYTFALTNSIEQIIKADKTNVGNNKLEKTISIVDLSDGVYFLIVDCNKSRVVKTIVKEN